MRITGGEFRSRKIAAPEGDAVRPTSDKMRQVMFNMLQKYNLPADAVVLDVFCGTGALGLEALSRGASFCTFMDESKKSLEFCRGNIESLKLAGRSKTIHRDALKPGKNEGAAATLAFLDPPYRKNLAPPVLAALAAGGWLAPGAICIAETEDQSAPPAPDGFALLDSRAHGGTKLWFLRYS